jgi:transposase-like protein
VFKLQVLRVIEAGKSLAQVTRECQGCPPVIHHWQQEHQRYAERALAGHGNSHKDDAHMAELERQIGQLTMENAI